MQILFLGTGAGMPSKQRNTSSMILKLLEERGSNWMFDCGEATQHQILRTTVKPRKIEKIFITHLHGDHIYGLPGLLGSRSFLGGDELLTIYGPKGIKDWLEVTLITSQTHLKYPLKIIEIEEGIIFEDEQFIVEARLLEHVVPCFGYRVTQKQLAPELLIEKADALGVPRGPLLRLLKSGQDVELPNGNVVRSSEVTGEPKEGFKLAVLGDTRYCENSILLAKESDVLIHEGTFDTGTEELAREYGHSTIVDAANVCEKAGAKNLIVNHISARFMPEDIKNLAVQVSEYNFPIYIADDFNEFSCINGKLDRI
ncbi:ribonuclease Z [Psychrobacillus sp. Sa2BUA9]|uniref:Ribonuclease Z n=1 Tax=Psychrobacillus faecigallinarum TaxID=2762235 RepID=A0ABR8R9X9_9BACI|nr:ribonuclease Z [Psychrobacillus faecigallinarum]MBD7944610.1 ribonuclease Z [Psychrobacillus faecigallinarum]